tara:strand:+ start:857 stop:2791 length:1935 start_codon:yes stop_codon:yes gene_type:complete
MMELEQALLNVYNTKDRQTAEPFAEGGTVVEAETETTPEMDRMLMEAQQGVAEGAQQDPNASLIEYIDELMAQRDQAEDPGERAQIEHMAEAAVLSQEAPMAAQAFEIAAQGRGEDTALAHLRPGEVVLPPEMFEDPEFERMVESRFGELDLDPEAHVVGLGIASLNPITGLEEFGFFKKIAKGIKKVVKKVVKPIAKVAQFIPGPWQPIAALANKAFTVYDVAKGRANPLSLLTVAGPLATGGGLGKNIGDITKAGGGSFLGGIGKGLAGTGSALRSGIGGLLKNPIGTFTGSAEGGGIPGLLRSATMSGQAKLTDTEILDTLAIQDAGLGSKIAALQDQGLSASQVLRELGVPSASFLNPQGGLASLGGGSRTGNIFRNLLGGGQPGQSQLGVIEDFLKGRPSDPVRQGGGIGGLFGGGGGGGGFNLGTLGALGAAGLIGKLAYDEAKNMRGVPLTPLTQEGSTGRYNIEAEIARRMGKEAPDPVEFGLLPEGTIPTLSGGRPTPTPREESQQPVMSDRIQVGGRMKRNPEGMINMMYGGPVMAFAEGGDVAIEDFKRMDGPINGPGTEVSDDIPAMLSDGEFVMTGRAVRGAGAFDLQRGDGGILTLTPNGSESRDKGTNLMYEMMELFSEFADKPKRAAA